jgi:hypothetical protein
VFCCGIQRRRALRVDNTARNYNSRLLYSWTEAFHIIFKIRSICSLAYSAYACFLFIIEGPEWTGKKCNSLLLKSFYESATFTPKD